LIRKAANLNDAHPYAHIAEALMALRLGSLKASKAIQKKARW
jgi:hypothetical protein